MRRILAPTLAILLALALLAAPMALARGGGERDADDKAKDRAADAKDKAAEARSHARDAANKTRDNKTADDDDAGKDNRTAGRRAALDAFRDYVSALREAWKANAASIRDACHAAEPGGDNATKEQRKSRAHCIRDGYKALFEAFKIERKAAKEEWKAERKALDG